MTVTDPAQFPAPAARRAAPAPPAPRRGRQRGLGWSALVLAGVVFVTALSLGLDAALPADGLIGALEAISSLAAVTGTTLMLFILLLISRWPVLERAFGQDHLVSWHKRLAPWAIWLVVTHVVVIITANAWEADAAWFSGIRLVMKEYPGILPALGGLLVMAAAGFTSWRRVRGGMRHETWWTVHLLTYVGVLLAFFHQILAGDTFSSGAARAFWIGLYAVVFGLIVWHRVAVPTLRSARHRLVVSEVVRESPDVVSVWLTGRHLSRLRVRPGQFLSFRFRTRGLRYEAHPYSVSAVDGDRLRITVKALGDGSRALAALTPGTRVGIEGPYGAMTPDRAGTSRSVLVAGGVGISPVVALAGALGSPDNPVDVVYRASTADGLVLADDLEALERQGKVRLHLLAGPRSVHTMTPDHLGSLLGDVSAATFFVCGPTSLTDQLTASARALGVPPSRIHRELFDL